jgi:hypothetical protein
MLGDSDTVQSSDLYLGNYPCNYIFIGFSKEGSLTTMCMQIQLKLNLLFPLKPWRPFFFKSLDPFHPVLSGLNQEIEVSLKPQSLV